MHCNVLENFDWSFAVHTISFFWRKKPELASKMVEGIRDFTAIVERDGVYQPVLDAQNGEELMHVQPGVSIVLGSHPPESPGTLYISTKYVMLSLTLLILYIVFGWKVEGKK